MTMKSFSAIFRAFTKDSENAVDQKIIAIEKQLSVITKLHAKDMKEMKALIESVSKASVENLKVDSSIKEEIKEIKEEDKKELAFMIANVEKELNDARDELEKLQSTPKLGSEFVEPGVEGEDIDNPAVLIDETPAFEAKDKDFTDANGQIDEKPKAYLEGSITLPAPINIELESTLNVQDLQIPEDLA